MQFLHQLPLAKEKRIVFVLITSSLLGLIAGLLQPTLQVAVEQGQVLGGIVQYPTDNPFFIYQSKTWTFLAQFSAISLRLGLSEITLSLFFSGLAGVLSFSGFALWLFALADDILFALLAPPVFIKVLDIIVWSFNYPTNVLGIIHTYGMIGMTFIFFTSGLFAVGYRRWAWLFAGLSPAIHPSLGLWFNIILWVSVLSDFKNLRASFVEAVKFSSLGYILSAISLGYHLGSYQSPSLDAATAQRYMQAYLTFWDNHRMAIGFWRIDVSIIIAGMFVSVIWLLFKKIDLPHNAEFILRLYTATVIIGGIVVAILYSPLPFTLPDVLFVLMPTRFLNFAIVGYLPLTFGLFWRYRMRAWASVAMTLMIVCLALTVFFYSPSFWYMLLVQLAAWSLILLVMTRNEHPRSENWSIFIVVVVVLAHFLRSSSASLPEINISSRTQAILVSFVIASAFFIIPTIFRTGVAKSASLFATDQVLALQRLLQKSPRFLQLVALTTLAIFFIWAMPFGNFLKIQREFVDDFHSLPLNALSLQQNRAIIIGSNCSPTVQLITRRSVINYMPINMLPYAIEGAPSMEKILRDIYDMDFFSPPTPTEHIQFVWEKRSATEWSTLGNQYNVGDVLAPSSWAIQLLRIGNDNICTLYRIPS
ncbi:MAG: hypothetical protein HZC38_11950 [Chloroflexi bacterium]|nr:hypothetical protein [Chloroflexota bacterium]